MNEPTLQPDTPATHDTHPITGIKLAFLVVLIAGAAAMALVAILALLLGGFNDFVGKALMTIFILFTHSLIILTIVTSLSTAQLKKSLVGSTIAAVAGANIVTAILGLWRVIPSETSWHLVGLYFILIGGAFLVSSLRRAVTGRTASDGVYYAAIAAVVVLVVALIPWVLVEEPHLPSIYYRAVGAVGILITALAVIGGIIRQIYVSRDASLRAQSIMKAKISTPVQGLYSVVGVVTVIVWLAGFAGFYFSADSTQDSSPSSYSSDDTY